jgi:hypothetical protein
VWLREGLMDALQIAHGYNNKVIGKNDRTKSGILSSLTGIFETRSQNKNVGINFEGRWGRVEATVGVSAYQAKRPSNTFLFSFVLPNQFLLPMEARSTRTYRRIGQEIEQGGLGLIQESNPNHSKLQLISVSARTVPAHAAPVGKFETFIGRIFIVIEP